MNNLSVIIMFVFGTCLAGESFTSGVFKYIDENGQTTFAFALCVSKKVTVKKEQDAGPTVEEQMASLDAIDGRISRLNRQFRKVRLKQEQGLLANTDPDAQRQIRNGYQ
mgnify:FL=1